MKTRLARIRPARLGALVALAAISVGAAAAIARENPDPRIRKNEEFTGYINGESGTAQVNVASCNPGARGNGQANIALQIKIRREDGPGGGIDDGNGYTGRGPETSDQRVPVRVLEEDGDLIRTINRYGPITQTDVANIDCPGTSTIRFQPKRGKRGPKWQPDFVDVEVTESD